MLTVEQPLGVMWEHLTVKGVGGQHVFVKTLPVAILRTVTGADLFGFFASRFPALFSWVPGRHAKLRTILTDFNGLVRDEMLLVLGQPGSGCSTFLRALANQRDGFAAVEGTVDYAGFSAAKIHKSFRGEVVYNEEDDLHFPKLTVEQTLRFALENKVPSQPARPRDETRRQWIDRLVTVSTRMFGIAHVKDTVVGDAFVRGVSGGERKRVSLAETLASGASVISFDNSTRGLDSSTAVDYVRSLRILTDVAQRCSIVTLYQAAQSIYELFNKVLLIDEGRCIFFGTASEARPYFENLGFACPPRQTTPDFLTSLTDPTARSIRPGWEDRYPRTAEEREAAYKSSDIYKRVQREIAAYKQEMEASDHAEGRLFKERVRAGKAKSARKSASWQVGFLTSVWACTKREFLLKNGDRQAFYTKTGTNLVIALIVSSVRPGTSCAGVADSGCADILAIRRGDVGRVRQVWRPLLLHHLLGLAQPVRANARRLGPGDHQSTQRVRPLSARRRLHRPCAGRPALYHLSE